MTDPVIQIEVLLDTALEHFSHGWNALDKAGMVSYRDRASFPPSVTNGIGTCAYHFAAVGDTLKRAYEIVLRHHPDEPAEWEEMDDGKS